MRRGGGSCLISAEMPTNFVQLRRSVLATFREDFCSLSLRVCGGVSLSLSLSLFLYFSLSLLDPNSVHRSLDPLDNF